MRILEEVKKFARILLVEDDIVLKEMYLTILRDAGFQTNSAANGLEALEKIKSFLPDLILLDIFLPRMTGFDVIDKIKADPILQKIPIIVLTNIYIDRQALLKKGIEHCLIKAEVTPDQVVEKIQSVLQPPVHHMLSR